MKIVPTVLGINQCNFTMLSPDLHSKQLLFGNPHTITANKAGFV
jgi:hypothetical protein